MSNNSEQENLEVPPIGTTVTTETTSEEKQTHAVKKEVMKKREELIKLSEDGEISQSVQNLKFMQNMRQNKQKKQMYF